MKSINVILSIDDNYTNKSTWNETILYCPWCGKRKVWVEDDWDDMSGSVHVCLSCHCNFIDVDSIDFSSKYLDVINYLLNPPDVEPEHKPRPPSEFDIKIAKFYQKAILERIDDCSKVTDLLLGIKNSVGTATEVVIREDSKIDFKLRMPPAEAEKSTKEVHGIGRQLPEFHEAD